MLFLCVFKQLFSGRRLERVLHLRYRQNASNSQKLGLLRLLSLHVIKLASDTPRVTLKLLFQVTHILSGVAIIICSLHVALDDLETALFAQGCFTHFVALLHTFLSFLVMLQNGQLTCWLYLECAEERTNVATHF